MSRKLTATEREILEKNERTVKLHEKNPREWNFLYGNWAFNNKRYCLKSDPGVFCDLTRSTDVDSILVGTWK